MQPLGIYIHTPFCTSKCAYCDFYSFSAAKESYTLYKNKILSDIKKYSRKFPRPCDTLYFGGGTPSLLGGDYIAEMVNSVKKYFGFTHPEITLEANPGDDLFKTLEICTKSGVNRLSVGVQSGIDAELKALGRRHTTGDVIKTVLDAKAAGIENISLDLMLGIPFQTDESLKKSIDFLCGLDPSHISAYMLKIEQETVFGKHTPCGLPDDDRSADLYLAAVELLKPYGYEQYEISNFAKNRKISRHNKKYWTGSDYLGLGPSAHSMIDNKRFYFPRNFDQYIKGTDPVFDGSGGTAEEYVMLRLRLCEGFQFSDYYNKFGIPFPENKIQKLKQFSDMDYGTLTETGFFLTPKGFLVSNFIISELI